MKTGHRPYLHLRVICLGLVFIGGLTLPVDAGPRPESFWPVEEIRAGMKGIGRTVIKGTKIEDFDVEVLGVLRNTSPGRDLILARLAGLNLEKTGVIAGMSGSPVYIQGKLVGAVAYAWPFGTEPIAGITPFVQMHDFVAAYEKRDLADTDKPRRIGLLAPVTIQGQSYDTVTVSSDFSNLQPQKSDGLWMVPLRTPLVASGFSTSSLSVLRDSLGNLGMVPVQGGAVSAKVAEEEKNTPLLPGGALTVALITGDFDLSGIGTVTHIEGKRVYGWGHPFFGLGACEFPLMTAYVHTIMPRSSLSFKIGSPLKMVGVINADVSTTIAGWLDRQPDMLPVSVNVVRAPGGQSRSFNVKIARQRAMIGPMLLTVLTNSVDMEGDLPEELTANLKVRIDIEGREPLILEDVFSGSSLTGNRAPQALFSQVVNLINLLTFNNFQNLKLTKIESTAEIQSGRTTAEIEAIEVESDTYAPGQTLRATVFLRPYKGVRQRVQVELPLPADLPEGNYTAQVMDELASARQDLRDNPGLSNPQTLDNLFKALEVQIGARRTSLVVRVATQAVGVSLGGKALPNLPPSMVQILGNGRRTGAQTIAGALVARHPTSWVVTGGENVRFTVSKNKRVVE